MKLRLSFASLLTIALALCQWTAIAMQYNQAQQQEIEPVITYPYPHKPHIYEIEGVEFIDKSKLNATLKVVLQQEFFTNIQKNVLNQVLAIVAKDNVDLTLLNNTIVSVPGVGSLNITIDHFNLEEMSLNTIDDLVTLGENNTATINLRNFTGNLNAHYQYITDPPVLADVGDFQWIWRNTSLFWGGSLSLDDDYYPQMKLNTLDLEADRFDITLDGVSDISQVVSRLVTYVGNIVRTRLESICRYLQNKDPTKIQNLINVLLHNIPEIIHITDTLYIEGGLHESPNIDPGEFVEWVFDISLQDDNYKLNDTNIANFSEAVAADSYQMQLFVSEYLLQSALAAGYEADKLVFPAITFEDWEMNLFRAFLTATLGSQFSTAGFDTSTTKCQFVIYAANETYSRMPYINITEEQGFNLTAQLEIDLQCTPKNDSTQSQYLQVFTIITNRFTMAAQIKIDKGLVIRIINLVFNPNIDNIINSKVGKIPFETIKNFISLTQSLVVNFLRAILNNTKIDLGWIIRDLFNIQWFDFDESILHYYDEYFILFTTPHFNITQPTFDYKSYLNTSLGMINESPELKSFFNQPIRLDTLLLQSGIVNEAKLQMMKEQAKVSIQKDSKDAMVQFLNLLSNESLANRQEQKFANEWQSSDQKYLKHNYENYSNDNLLQ